MNTPKRDIYWATAQNGHILTGSELRKSPNSTTQQPVLVYDFQVAEDDGRFVILSTEPACTFEASVPRKGGGYSYFYKSTDGYMIETDGQSVVGLSMIVTPGMLTDHGKVIAVGERLVVVENGHGRKTLEKSVLQMFVTDAELAIMRADAMEAEIEFRKGGLRISRGKPSGESHRDFIQRVKTPSAVAPKAPSVSPKPASVSPKAPDVSPQRASTPASQYLRTGTRAGQNIPKPDEAREGMTRMFGPNDLRVLMRAQNGQLRWMNADEYREEMQRRGREQQAQPGVSAGHEFRVGQEVSHGGEKVEVVSHGNNIVAYKRADGSTGTFRADQYNAEAEQRRLEPPAQRVKPAGGKGHVILPFKAEAQRKEQQRAEATVSPEAGSKDYIAEIERIHQKAEADPDFQTFKTKTLDKDWSQLSPFEFEKDAEYEAGSGISFKGKLRRVWNPETKTHETLFLDRSFKLQYGGKEYALDDVNGRKLTLRDDTGATQEIDTYDLDKHRGQIQLDEEGNAHVVQSGKELGAFAQAEGVTQEDLLTEGTIRIINDEVWKRVGNETGQVFTDVLLGRVNKGVTFFKHGNETGTVDGNRRTYVVKKRNTRRNIEGKLPDNLTKVHRIVVNMRGEVEREHTASMDANLASARLGMAGGASKRGKIVDTSLYHDTAQEYMEPHIEAITASYGTPEWKANVDGLAEHLYLFDTKRAEEVQAFNALSKSGMLKAVPSPKSMDEYREIAANALDQKRGEALREQSKAKMQSRLEERRAAGKREAFEPHEMAEMPTTAKAVQQTPFTIRDSRNQEYQVAYAVVPMGDVVQSHAHTGEADALHPTELQARKRQDAQSVVQMGKIAKNINDDVVTDNADATRGAPVAYSKDGKVYVIQGNGRAAGIKGTEGDQRQKYYGMMLEKAKNLGFDIGKIDKNDMLVRVLTPKHTYDEAKQLAAFGQKSSALPYTEVEEARAVQNAGKPVTFQNLNMEGIGNRAIDESNVATFIRNNPEVYRQIVEGSGYTNESIQYNPSIQAQIVNTNFLAQLNRDFVEDMAGRDTRTHLFAKRIAPILVDNQTQVTSGKLHADADMQKLLGDTIKSYDSLDTATRALLNKPEFMNAESDDPRTLVHRMRQEDLMSAGGKEENRWRDPLHVISLMAYHQATQPRKTPAEQDRAMLQYAIKLRRFNDGVKHLASETSGDMFAAMQSDEEKQRDMRSKLTKLAHKTLLENKKYAPGEEQLTQEEQEASAEAGTSGDVHGTMRSIAESHGFSLRGEEKIKKSIFRFRWTEHQRQCAMLKAIASQQLSLPGMGKHYAGETKQFGPHDLRTLVQSGRGLRWASKDEIARMKQQRPASVQEAHAKYRNQIASTTIRPGNTFEHQGETFHVTRVGEQLVAAESGSGKAQTFRREDIDTKKLNRTSVADAFNIKGRVQTVPMSSLQFDHEPDEEKGGRARRHIKDAIEGKTDKRAPISVYQVKGTGRHYVVNGNTTAQVLSEMGHTHIPVDVMDTVDEKSIGERMIAFEGLEAFGKQVGVKDITKPVTDEQAKSVCDAYNERIDPNRGLSGKVIFRNASHVFMLDEYGEMMPVNRSQITDVTQAFLWKSKGRPKELQNDLKEYEGDAGINELFRNATFNKRALKKALQGICADAGVEFNEAMFDKFAVKSLESLRLKLSRPEKLSGIPNYDARHINDALRYTFELNEWGDAQRVIDAFHKSDTLTFVAKSFENKFTSPTELGYRDANFVAKINGVTVEIQMNFKPILEAKKGEGHKLYEKVRDLDIKIGKTSEESERQRLLEEKKQYTEQSRELYENAARALFKGADKEGVDFTISLRRAAASSGGSMVQETSERSGASFTSLADQKPSSPRTKVAASTSSPGPGKKRMAKTLSFNPWNALTTMMYKVKNGVRLFKAQLSMFGGAPTPAVAKPPATMQASRMKMPSGMNWNRKGGQEKPGHKYIRRYKGRDGQWRYVYREGQTGREFVGDEKGKELPKHHDWKEGDTVHHEGRSYTLSQMGDNVAVVRDDHGREKTVSFASLENWSTHQSQLRTESERSANKYRALIDEFEEDQRQGATTGKYETGVSHGDIERRKKYAREEYRKHADKLIEEAKLLARPVYHGTLAKFDEFNEAMLGSNTGAESAKLGFFFTPNQKVAESYASTTFRDLKQAQQNIADAQKEIERLTGGLDQFDVERKLIKQEVNGIPSGFSEELTAKLDEQLKIIEAGWDRLQTEEEVGGFDEPEVAEEGEVKKSWLEMKNPYVHDMKGSIHRDESYASIIDRAKKAGHDSVIIRNTYDAGHSGGDEETDIHVVFKPDQIKTWQDEAHVPEPKSRYGIFNEHAPSTRIHGTSVENTRLSDIAELGYKPEDLVTVYRGVPKGSGPIQPGDWVTTLPQLARDYAGTGEVVTQKVRASELLTEADGVGEELIYSPESTKDITKSLFRWLRKAIAPKTGQPTQMPLFQFNPGAKTEDEPHEGETKMEGGRTYRLMAKRDMRKPRWQRVDQELKTSKREPKRRQPKPEAKLQPPPDDIAKYHLTTETERAHRETYIKAGEPTKSSRHIKSNWNPEGKFKVGDWRIDNTGKTKYGYMIEQLREVDVDGLLTGEDTPADRMEDADRYAGWQKAKDADQPPPILVVETDNGDLKIVDGHRRYYAAKKNKQKKILAWVSPNVRLPMTYGGQPDKAIGAPLTYETRYLHDREDDQSPFGFRAQEDLPAPWEEDMKVSAHNPVKDWVSVELKEKGTVKIPGLKYDGGPSLIPIIKTLADQNVEQFVAVPMRDGQPLTIDVVTIGIVDASLVSPQEALRSAVEMKADSIAFFHNHPSGGLQPSQQDISMSRGLESAVKALGMKYEGNYIVTREGWTNIEYIEPQTHTAVPEKAKKQSKTLRLFGRVRRLIKRKAKPDSALADDKLVEIARKHIGSDGVYIVSTSTALNVDSIRHVPEKKDEAITKEYLNAAIKSGSTTGFVILVDSTIPDTIRGGGMNDFMRTARVVMENVKEANVSIQDFILLNPKSGSYYTMHDASARSASPLWKSLYMLLAKSQIGMFEESKHPREGKGSEKGGRFAKKPGSVQMPSLTPKQAQEKKPFDLKAEVEKKVQAKTKNTWMSQFPKDNPDHAKMSDGELDKQYRSHGRTITNDTTDEDRAEIASLYREHLRRWWTKQLSAEREEIENAKPPYADGPFAGRRRDSHGFLIPQEGDEVTQTVRGFGGMGAVLRAKVERHGKKLYAVVTGGGDVMFQAQAGKKYDLEKYTNWLVVDDPEIDRRQAERDTKRQQEEDARKKERENAEKQTADSISEHIKSKGHKPFAAKEVNVGDRVANHMDITNGVPKEYEVVSVTPGDVIGVADPDNEPEYYEDDDGKKHRMYDMSIQIHGNNTDEYNGQQWTIAPGKQKTENQVSEPSESYNPDRVKITGVAFKINGKLYTGTKGHADLYMELPQHVKDSLDEDDPNLKFEDGFVDNNGRFLTRSEAQKLVGVATSEQAREKGMFGNDEIKKAFYAVPFTVDMAKSIQMGFFDESKHPRDPKGTETGGQFTSKPATPENPADRVWDDGETVGQYLERHKIKVENGHAVYYHGRPKGETFTELKVGSYLAETAEDARHFAGRDRGLKPSQVEVFEVRVPIDAVQPGVFATVNRPVKLPDAPVGKAKPLRVSKVAFRVNGEIHTDPKARTHGELFNALPKTLQEKINDTDQNVKFESGFVDKDGKWVTRHDLMSETGAMNMEGARAQGLVDEPENEPLPKSFIGRVKANFEHMKAPASEWSVVPMTGISQVEDERGFKVDLPQYDFSSVKDYKYAPSLFGMGESMGSDSDMNCELCGHSPIKNIFWIKNDDKKWTLRVGSECVTHFNEMSGKELTRDKKIEIAAAMLVEAKELAHKFKEKWSQKHDRSVYWRFGWHKMELYEKTKKTISQLDSAKYGDERKFTEGGTERWLLTFYSNAKRRDDLKLRLDTMRAELGEDRFAANDLIEKITVSKDGKLYQPQYKVATNVYMGDYWLSEKEMEQRFDGWREMLETKEKV